MTADFQTMTREADAWIGALRRQSAQDGIPEYIAFAEALLADDARVAAGEPSSIPIAARGYVESRRLSAERVAKLKNPSHHGELAAKEQQLQMQMRAARKRAEALLSDPANVDLLERLLKHEREAEAVAKKLKVAV